MGGGECLPDPMNRVTTNRRPSRSVNEGPSMRRRLLATLPVAAVLLAGSGCLCLDDFPRLRGLFHGNGNGCCPPGGVVYDVEGPILDGMPVAAPAPPPTNGMPPPRLVPQPMTSPEAEPTPFKPTNKKGK